MSRENKFPVCTRTTHGRARPVSIYLMLRSECGDPLTQSGRNMAVGHICRVSMGEAIHSPFNFGTTPGCRRYGVCAASSGASASLPSSRFIEFLMSTPKSSASKYSEGIRKQGDHRRKDDAEAHRDGHRYNELCLKAGFKHDRQQADRGRDRGQHDCAKAPRSGLHHGLLDRHAALSGLFMKSTMIRLSFTTTPVSAIRPKREIMLIALPMTICPMTAPIRPNGMMDMMISGCV